jgi:hypothetical protein
MHERRTDKRIEMNLTLEVQLIKRNYKTPLTGQIKLKTKDVSKGGACLKWPRGWKCPECDNCPGWVFNKDCKLKKGMSEPLDRRLNEGTRIKLRFQKRPLDKKEYYAKVVWIDNKSDADHGYDAGLSFIDADRQLEGILGL